MGEKWGKATRRIFREMESFISMLKSWLWYCTIVLQMLPLGKGYLGSFCIISYNCTLLFSCYAVPMHCSLPGSSVQGILQARILEWVAISSSRGSSRPRDRTYVSFISGIGRQILYQLSHKGSPRILEWVAYPFSNDACSVTIATPWTAAHQAPLFMGFSR